MSDYAIQISGGTFAAHDGTTDADAGGLLDAELAAIATALATKYDSSTTLPIANGGTASTSASAARTALGIGELAQQDTILSALLRTTELYASGTTSASLDSVTLTTGDIVLLFATSEATMSGTGYSHLTINQSAGTATCVFDHDNSAHIFGNQGTTANQNICQGATIVSCSSGGTATFNVSSHASSNRSSIDAMYLYGLVIRGG